MLNYYSFPSIPFHCRPDCQEYAEILDGEDVIIQKICSHDLTRKREPFKYNITTNSAYVKYYNLKGQISNPDPIWINYKFKTVAGELIFHYS